MQRAGTKTCAKTAKITKKSSDADEPQLLVDGVPQRGAAPAGQWRYFSFRVREAAEVAISLQRSKGAAELYVKPLPGGTSAAAAAAQKPKAADFTWSAVSGAGESLHACDIDVSASACCSASLWLLFSWRWTGWRRRCSAVAANTADAAQFRLLACAEIRTFDSTAT